MFSRTPNCRCLRDSREPALREHIRTFVDRENRQKVGVMMDIADLDSMLAAIANPSPKLAAAMQDDTVRPETLTILVES